VTTGVPKDEATSLHCLYKKKEYTTLFKQKNISLNYLSKLATSFLEVLIKINRVHDEIDN
jgi:hypothetical protein